MIEEIRFTVYSGDIPCGHGATEADALADAKRRLRKGVKPTAVVRRLRNYPFTKLDRKEIQ